MASSWAGVQTKDCLLFFLTIPGKRSRKGTYNRWKGDQKEFGVGPRGQLLEDEGGVFDAQREHYLPERNRRGVLHGRWVGSGSHFLAVTHHTSPHF